MNMNNITFTGMKSKKDIVAAVDIGTTKIVTAVARRNENNRIEILAISRADSRGVRRGVVRNIEETVASIQSTVDLVKKQSGIDFSEVYVGVAGEYIRSIRNRSYLNRDSWEEEITDEEIRRLLDDSFRVPVDAMEKVIHVLPQDFVVDNEPGIINPVGMTGKRLEGNFHIVIGKVDSLKTVERCLSHLNLKVKSFILEPIASAEAVLTEDEKEAGVALIDIGGGTSDLAIYYDGIIRHTAVIPFGGNVITTDIKEGCGILLRQAEMLKIKYGSALGDLEDENKVATIPGISGREPREVSFRTLAYIIQARMEEIIDRILFQIETSGYADKLAAGIVITGGGALLRNLPHLIKFRTGMDVRLGYPSEHLAGNLTQEANHPMYSTCLGLVMLGCEDQAKKKPEAEEPVIEKIPVTEQGESQPVSEPEPLKVSGPQGKTLFKNLQELLSNLFTINDSNM